MKLQGATFIQYTAEWSTESEFILLCFHWLFNSFKAENTCTTSPVVTFSDESEAGQKESKLWIKQFGAHSTHTSRLFRKLEIWFLTTWGVNKVSYSKMRKNGSGEPQQYSTSEILFTTRAVTLLLVIWFLWPLWGNKNSGVGKVIFGSGAAGGRGQTDRLGGG